MLLSSRACSRCSNSSRCFRGSAFRAASKRRFSSSWITLGIFQQPHEFVPHDRIEMILTNRRVVANRSAQMTVGVGTQAPIVVKLARRGLGGGAVEGVAATLTNQHPLQQRRFEGAPGRMMFVLLQLLLRPVKGLFTDQGRNGNFDPIRSRPLVVGTIAARPSLAFPQRSRDPLSRS